LGHRRDLGCRRWRNGRSQLAKGSARNRFLSRLVRTPRPGYESGTYTDRHSSCGLRGVGSDPAACRSLSQWPPPAGLLPGLILSAKTTPLTGERAKHNKVLHASSDRLRRRDYQFRPA
jgi:hypothetical protein